MRIYFILTFSVLFSYSIFAQGSEKLYDLFPEMPALVDNEDLRALVGKGNAIPGDFYTTLRHREIGPIYPIGKIESKKAIILFYADWSKAKTKQEDDLVTVNTIAFHKKKGREMPGSSNSYLTMSGDDALYRMGEITFRDGELSFKIESYKRKGGTLEETTVEVYTIGKKGLEFLRKGEE